MSANLYRILGVDPDAEPVVIRSAYLALMRLYHPDQAGGGGDPRRAQEIGAAYAVLRDPDRRAAYDAGRVASIGPVAGASTMPAARVRGGAIGRNAFVALALATAGLAWWGLNLPTDPPVRTAQVASPPRAEPEPGPMIPASELAQAEIPQAERPQAPPEKPVEVILPPELPELAPVISPVVARRRDAENAGEPERMAEARPRVAPVAARAIPAAKEQIDLAGLESHLRLLTDQSVKAGSNATRARIFETSETFTTRLRACPTDSCRRDIYLARNQEVAAIMQR